MAIQHRHSQNRNVCVYITKVTRCRRSFFSSSSIVKDLYHQQRSDWTFIFLFFLSWLFFFFGWCLLSCCYFDFPNILLFFFFVFLLLLSFFIFLFSLLNTITDIRTIRGVLLFLTFDFFILSAIIFCVQSKTNAHQKEPRNVKHHNPPPPFIFGNSYPTQEFKHFLNLFLSLLTSQILQFSSLSLSLSLSLSQLSHTSISQSPTNGTHTHKRARARWKTILTMSTCPKPSKIPETTWEKSGKNKTNKKAQLCCAQPATQHIFSDYPINLTRHQDKQRNMKTKTAEIMHSQPRNNNKLGEKKKRFMEWRKRWRRQRRNGFVYIGVWILQESLKLIFKKEYINITKIKETGVSQACFKIRANGNNKLEKSLLLFRYIFLKKRKKKERHSWIGFFGVQQRYSLYPSQPHFHKCNSHR